MICLSLASILFIAISFSISYFDSKKNYIEGNFSHLVNIDSNVQHVIYTVESCPACQALKSYLDDKGIQYFEKEITLNPVYGEEFDTLDLSTVPVIITEKYAIIGFHKEIVDKEFGI